MKDIYLAVGHGRRSNGTFDPGAVGSDGRYEHYEAHEVVAEIAEGLDRSGVSYTSEDHGSAGPEDPNFSGTIKNVNSGNYKCALEIHFDWSKAPEGGFGFWISSEGKKFADRIFSRWSKAGIETRPNWHKERGDLAFLNQTKPPAVLWECGRVRDFPRAHNEKMGEAIAAGVCDYLGKTYVPQNDQKHYKVAVIGLGEIDDILAYLLGKRHVFKRVSENTVDNYSIGHLVRVGGHAARKYKGRPGTNITGDNRFLTADKVLAAIMGPDVDRTSPW